MPDPATCDHEWVDDGTLEVFPPIATSHCVKCGLRRHIKTSTGEVTFLPPVQSGDRSEGHSSRGNRDGSMGS